MKINLRYVNEDNPVTVGTQGPLGKSQLTIWVAPSTAIKSRAHATGFVFKNENVATAVVSRLLFHCVRLYPSSTDVFRKLL